MASELDEMIEFSVARLATEDSRDIRSLVRDLAMRWPLQSALSLSFAISSAASIYEETMSSTRSERVVASAYQLAALVAADVFALEAMGQTPANCQALLHFWRRTDPYFLEL
ncbi:MAG: hypothetical protein AAGL89_15630 [Pseudomonadota bacterium]